MIAQARAEIMGVASLTVGQRDWADVVTRIREIGHRSIASFCRHQGTYYPELRRAILRPDIDPEFTGRIRRALALEDLQPGAKS